MQTQFKGEVFLIVVDYPDKPFGKQFTGIVYEFGTCFLDSHFHAAKECETFSDAARWAKKHFPIEAVIENDHLVSTFRTIPKALYNELLEKGNKLCMS